MPIYEYKCSACGKRHEVLQKMSDDPIKECPDCHAQALKKLLSAASFRLAGSGWYETDFKKDKRRNLHESSADKKSDDKPPSASSESAGGPPASGKTAGTPDTAASGKTAGAPDAAASGKTAGTSDASASGKKNVSP